MKKIRSIAVVLVCLAGAASGVVPFERYQVILDRAPFGVAATSTQSVTALKNLRLSALIRMPDGPRAGFVDGQGKNDFVLRLNEKSENDVELLGVDYAKEQVTIRHEGQLLVLGMQPGEIAAIAAASPMMSFGHPPSALNPGPPPSLQNLSPELRMIMNPSMQEPNPYSPEGRRWQMQKYQLLNPTLPSDIGKMAIPMPGGLVMPQVQESSDLPPSSDQSSPTEPRRSSRRGVFGR